MSALCFLSLLQLPSHGDVPSKCICQMRLILVLWRQNLRSACVLWQHMGCKPEQLRAFFSFFFPPYGCQLWQKEMNKAKVTPALIRRKTEAFIFQSRYCPAWKTFLLFDKHWKVMIFYFNFRRLKKTTKTCCSFPEILTLFPRQQGRTLFVFVMYELPLLS